MDNTFDGSRIEPAAPEWKVYFEGNFWGHLGKDRAGTEIRLNRQFDWAGHHWVIPAVYSCGKGLVVDLCMRTEAEDIRRFIAKWNLTAENDSEENFTQEQQMQIELENPLGLDFSAQIELNGKTLQSPHGCAVGISPCLPDGAANEKVAQVAAAHYGLDDSYGWTIYRQSYLWAGKRRPEISVGADQRQDILPQLVQPLGKDSLSDEHGEEQCQTRQQLDQPDTLPPAALLLLPRASPLRGRSPPTRRLCGLAVHRCPSLSCLMDTPNLFREKMLYSS